MDALQVLDLPGRGRRGRTRSGGIAPRGGGRGRRGRRIAITQPGLDLITSGVPIWVKAQSDLAQALGGSADATRAALADLEQAAVGLEKAER